MMESLSRVWQAFRYVRNKESFECFWAWLEQ